MDFDDFKIIVLLLLVFVGCGVIAYYIVDHDEKQWAIYAKQHHCVETGRVEATVATGITGGKGGVAVVVVPEKHIYTCDGGYTVER
jgi:hypothetical protein